MKLNHSPVGSPDLLKDLEKTGFLAHFGGQSSERQSCQFFDESCEVSESNLLLTLSLRTGILGIMLWDLFI